MRWIWNAVAAVSLVTCVATCALWARTDLAAVGTDENEAALVRAGGWDVCAFAGRLWAARMTVLSAAPRPWFNSDDYVASDVEAARDDFPRVSRAWIDDGRPWSRGGFEFERETLGYGSNGPTAITLGVTLVAVPFWFLCLAAALPPGAWLARRLRTRRRSRAGLCPTCGYDLRASPGRCPECGKAVPPTGTA